jgi:SAM-dependent methyltransferase
VSDLPYFDLLLEGRRAGDPAAAVFSRYVHWGYWPRGARAAGPTADFLAAMDRLNDEVVAGARVQDGMTVLDAGCGFGGTLAGLSGKLPSARLVGVNFDRRQLEAALPSRARFLHADACALPLADESLDAALAVECIFHFPSRLRFLQEAARCLKPGARLSLSDFVPAGSLSGRKTMIGRWLEDRIAVGYGRAGAGWDDGGYAEMAEKAGLVVEQDRDVTRETLPTYPFLIRLIKDSGFGGGETKMLWPTRLIYWLSWIGALRYRIVSFRKPA